MSLKACPYISRESTNMYLHPADSAVVDETKTQSDSRIALVVAETNAKKTNPKHKTDVRLVC